jgi:hypothetical protein
MKFEEILPEIRKGCKARREIWRSPYFIRMTESGLMVDSDGDSRYITGKEMNADDWELVPEPTKYKVEVCLYSDGSAYLDFKRLRGLKDLISSNAAHLIETREIEWEVPQ